MSVTNMTWNVRLVKVTSLILVSLILVGLLWAVFVAMPSSVKGNPPFSGNRLVNTDPADRTQDCPDVAMNSTGAILVAWSDYRNNNDDIYFANSTDGGITWTNPNIRINTDGGTEPQNDPSIAVAPDDTIYVAWQDMRNGDPDIYFANSTDGGATWSDPNLNITTSAGWQIDPSIAIDSSGTVYAVWADSRSGDLDVYFTKSTDGGASWTEPNIRVNTANSSSQRDPVIAVDSAGTLYVTWLDLRNDIGDIYFANSTDGGMTWSSPNKRINDDTGTSIQQDPQIAAGSAGNVYVIWKDNRDGVHIYVVGSDDGGATWPYPNVRVNSDTALVGHYDPAIAVGSFGTVYAVWYDNRWNSFDIYSSYSFDSGMTWKSPDERVNDDAGDDTQRAPAITVGSTGYLAVVWQDYRYGSSTSDIYMATRVEPQPPNPAAHHLKVEGFYSSTTEIQHIVPHEPSLGFAYNDIYSDPMSDYNMSVWNEGGTTMLWWCNRSTSLPSGSEVTESYNTVPCPTSGSPLVDGTTYRFRVRVGNASGGWGPYSEIQFHLNEATPPVEPVSPANNSQIGASLNQNVTWTKGADPEGDDNITYYWEVASDSLFTTILASGNTNSTKSTDFTTTISSAYYWRVYANDTYEDSEYGNMPLGYWTFTTSSETTGTIEGSVADANGDPVPDANVELYNDLGILTGSTNTDESGDFQFGSIQAGNYTIRVWKSGYATYESARFELLVGETETINIVLQASEGLPPIIAELWWLWVIIVVVVIVVVLVVVLLIRGRKGQVMAKEPGDPMRHVEQDEFGEHPRW